MSEFNLQIGVVLDPNTNNTIKKQLSSLKETELKINKISFGNEVGSNLNNLLKELKPTLEISSIQLNSDAISNLKSSLAKQKFQVNIDSAKVSNKISSEIKNKLQNQKFDINSKYKINFNEAQKSIKSFELGIKNNFISSETKKASQVAEEYYRKLGKIVSVQESFNSSNQLTGFVVSLKNANNELEKLYYSIQKTQNANKGLSERFTFTGKNSNNANAYKQVENINKIISQYESKLLNFKKVNSSILSGLTQPLEKFETSLKGLSNKSSSVLEVKNNFALLNTEAKKIISTLNNSSSSIQKIDSAIKNLKQADSITKTLTNDFQKLATQPQSVLNELNKLPSMLQNIRNLESQQGRNSNWANAYKELNTTINNVRNNIKSLQTENSKILSQANQAISNNSISRQIALVQKNYNNIDSNRISPNLKNQFIELTNLSNKLNSSLDDKTKIQVFSKFQQLLPNVKNQLSAIAVEQGKFATNTMKANLSNQMEMWLNKNTAASKMFGSQIQQMIVELKTADSVKFNALKNEFQKIQIEARKAGKLGKSFKDSLKSDISKFSGWLGASTIVMRVIQSFKESVNELREVDTILTEISKTSDLTNSRLKQLGNDSFEKASTYGANASDYLYGVQEMYRAGYENADKLAELSTLAQSAGDLDAELANDYLIASDAAYGYGGNVEKLNALLDSQNQINKNSLPIWKHIGCRLLLSGKTWGHAIPRTRLYKIW